MTPADVLALAPPGLERHAGGLIAAAPLVAAGVAALVPAGRLAWMIALATAVLCLACAGVLSAQVWDGAVVSYAFGGWAPPLGIEYRIDPANAPILLLITAMGVLVLLYAPRSVEDEIDRRQHALFYAAFLVCFAGLIGVAATGDAFNLFVFLEISSLSTYVLVAMGAARDRRALTAAYNYLILGTIGATFFVIGVGFLYAATGTLNLVDMAERVAPLADNRMVKAGFAFVIIGLGLKIAMYPLHTWLPNAYAFAPSIITAFLAATATKAAFYALLRFMFGVFDSEFRFQPLMLVTVVAALAVLGMIIASLQAAFAVNIRRMLALSSVAQVGYMLLGVAMGTSAGLAAGFLHLINHAMMKGALFLALGIFTLRLGLTRISDFTGLGRVMPVTMAAFVIGALSLVGMPPTVGFVSKVFLLEAALERGWAWAAAVIAIASILAFVYVGRVLFAAYMQPPPMRDGAPARAAAPPLAMVGPLWVLALANLYFGIDASFPTALACRASGFLLGDPSACFGPGAAP